MLVRKQILLEESQVLELKKLAQEAGVSMSKMARNSIAHGVRVERKVVKKAVKKSKKITGAKFMIAQAKKAVQGPGNSEYDKYAYDL
jgi:hypothetical protein